MRLGLFGGSFDPVHLGHLLLAEYCREQCRLDQVLFLPAAVPPHKREQERTPAQHRVEMLELAVGGHEHFAVSSHEIDRGGVNYTVQTLTHFHNLDPEAELFFLLGADMLADLPNWYEAARLVELAIPVAVRRPGSAEPDVDCLASIAAPKRLEAIRRHQVEMPAVGISGSEIRRRMATGQSIRYQTTRAVEKYIETHGLYRTPSIEEEISP